MPIKLDGILCKLRIHRRFPWESVVDSTSALIVPSTFSSVGNALETIHRVYRRDPWKDQAMTCYVMSEKDAIAGILRRRPDRTASRLPWCVAICTQTFLHDVATRTEKSGKPATVFYFGDHDPSRENISGASERLIRELSRRRGGDTLRTSRRHRCADRRVWPSDKERDSRASKSMRCRWTVLRGLTRKAIESDSTWPSMRGRWSGG